MPQTARDWLAAEQPASGHAARDLSSARSWTPIEIAIFGGQALDPWCAALGGLYEVSPKADAKIATENAKFSMYHADRFLVGSMRAPAADFIRDRDLVEAGGVDHFLLQLLVEGSCRFDAGERAGRAQTGDIVCFDLSRPVRADAEALSAINLVVARRQIRLPPKRLGDAHGSVIQGGTTLGLMLARQLATMIDVAPNLATRDVDLAAELVSTLTSIGLAATTASGSSIGSAAASPSSASLVAPSIQTIRTYIDQNLASLALTPESIGRRFGLSRSALYRLFEPLGGVADYIRDRRMDRAILHLGSVGRGRGGIARLALQCGFPSDAAFSRAFRQRFGMTPSEAVTRLPHRQEQATAKGAPSVLYDWLKTLSG